MSNSDLRSQVESLRAMVEELRQSAGLKSRGSAPKVTPPKVQEEETVREAGPGKKTEAGMTQEQLAEFKKQQLLVNTLQNRIKELETKMTEAQSNIQEEDTRICELTKEEEDHTAALYREIDAINCSLSEKIAQQRNEVKKLAGDEYKPINYDPFNYGEAYGGDLVDFQARKRIIELKLQMNNLKSLLDHIGSHIKVSPSIDLGYKVVRMDQLLAASGFDRDIKAGAAPRDAGLLVSQTKSRVPDRVEYPRSEAFQTDKSKESQWQITDSIMQTMYRLEMELAELTRKHAPGQGAASRQVEELQESVKLLKESKIDRDQLSEITKNLPGQSTVNKNQAGSDKNLDSSEYVHKDVLTNNLQRINGAIDGIAKRLNTMERNQSIEPNNSSYVRSAAVGSCLPRHPGIGVKLARAGSRLKFTMAREYDIAVNGEVTRYHMPNPCFLRTRPHTLPKDIQRAAEKLRRKSTDNTYIRGLDGKMYLGVIGNDKSEQKDTIAAEKPMTPNPGKKGKGKYQKAMSPSNAKKDKAAAKIQAGFRGMKVRRSIDSQRSNDEANTTTNCLIEEPRWSDRDLRQVSSVFDDSSDNRPFYGFGLYH